MHIIVKKEKKRAIRFSDLKTSETFRYTDDDDSIVRLKIQDRDKKQGWVLLCGKDNFPGVASFEEVDTDGFVEIIDCTLTIN